MAPTHRYTGAVWWLGLVLAADAAGAHINPGVAGVGAVVSARFAYGRWSPDADCTWLAELGHRQATHRPRTAVCLTAVSLVVWAVTLAICEQSNPRAVTVFWVVHWVLWAPVSGWWSHLAGDAVFGRIPVGEATGRVLSRVLPGLLVRDWSDREQHWWTRPVVRPFLPAAVLRRSRGEQPWWIGLGLDTDGLIERGKRRLPERNPKTGLHLTEQVLPFAPTTLLMRVASVVLMVLAVTRA